MFMPRKTDEFEGLPNAAEHREPDSSAQDALGPWESEVGGSVESLARFDLAHSALADNAGWLASNNAGWLATYSGKYLSKNDGIPSLALDDEDEEDRILRCLGAALIMRWNAIPTKLQRELFGDASSVGALLQTGALKGQIARFLHKHKDDAA